MEGKQAGRAKTLLPEVLPDLIALLDGAPDFGQCGLDVIFHEGAITRVITRAETSRKIDEKKGGR